MMVEAVVALVVLGLAGSIFWVLPSPVQRLKAKTRSEALSLGFTVRFSEYQYTSIIDGDEYEDPLICYAKRPSPNKKKYNMLVLKRWDGEKYYWYTKSISGLSEKAEIFVNAELEEAAKGAILGLGLSDTGYRFYWLERLGDHSLVELTKSMDTLWEECDRLA